MANDALAGRAFDGRSIVVTGAASGMGAEVARMLAAQGASVLATDRSAAGLDAVVSEIRAAGGVATAKIADLLDIEAPDHIVEAAVAAYGSLHSLVCCAGLLETAPLEDLTIASFERVLTVNLRAPLFLTKAARPHLVQSGAAVVMITSQSAVTPGEYQAAYAASKGGLVTLVQALAAELGPAGIRVNAVSPGAANTPMSDNAEEEFAYLRQVVPNRRVAEPEDIANVVLFLLSDAAIHVHAQNLMVDGGSSQTSAAPPNRTDV
jgi:NAD(P)-dependent dehydrogenase (short-subunit alcohol dehydrogenase family)